MSYILEALKKAQAERQLGDTPTIHALPLHGAARPDDGARRKRRWAGAAILALLVAGAGALFAWRQQPPPPAPAIALRVPVPVPVPMPVPVPSPPAARPALAQVEPVRAPVAAPAPVAPPPARLAPAPAPVPKAKPEPAAVEDTLPGMRELPDAIRRELPQLTFGGYIYSTNPADRLLLIDKVLRHEGEEIAPGLVLEKLQPKAALMNYKGYRYRIPY